MSCIAGLNGASKFYSSVPTTRAAGKDAGRSLVDEKKLVERRIMRSPNVSEVYGGLPRDAHRKPHGGLRVPKASGKRSEPFDNCTSNTKCRQE